MRVTPLQPPRRRLGASNQSNSRFETDSMSSKPASLRVDSHSGAIHCCLDFKHIGKVLRLGAESFEKGVLQCAACFWSQWASREVGINKSMLASLSEECAVFGVAPDVDEVADAL